MTYVRTGGTQLPITVKILVHWTVREAAPFSERCLHTAYPCLGVPLISRNLKDKPWASFRGLARARPPPTSLRPACTQNSTNTVLESYFTAPFPSTFPLLCHLLFHSSGILVPDVTSLFPLAGNLPFSHNPVMRCLLEKPKDSNFLGRHLIKFPKREEESPPPKRTERTSRDVIIPAEKVPGLSLVNR